MHRLLLVVALGTALLVGCSDPFQVAQTEDTIEAYETFLAENPGSRFEMQAQSRLEDLYLEKARKDGTLESFDTYLEKFPEGNRREEALKDREQYLYDWAKKQNTSESYAKYLEEYPRADSVRLKDAERRKAVVDYGKIKLGKQEIKQVNLAENPEGPLDGWGFFVDVTNEGDRSIEDLRLTVIFRHKTGLEIGRKEWPVVAKRWPIPMEDEKKIPMKPGETRTWVWTGGHPGEGWDEKFEVEATRLVLVE